jgi:hypothetical protein
MEAVDLSEIQLRHIYSIGGLLARNKMHHFRKSINNHKDGVITFLGPWQAQHKVLAHVGLWPLRNRKRHV